MPDLAQQLTLKFHGAAGTVTGSCMELVCGGRGILIDCGMFQGSRSLEALNHGDFGFDVASIDAVVLTHAHIDHCGLLPKLFARGYRNAIWCTPATTDLLEFMLADAGRIQEGDTARRNRRRDRAGDTRFEPLYTEEDALEAWRLSRPVPLGEWFEPAPGFRVRFWNAGHILGAASVEVEAGGVRSVFSGDLGPAHKAFEPDPEAPAGVDYVVCESTYGDRTRQKQTIEQRRSLLEQEVRQALARGGNLVIPVFALERTQELLLDFARLADANRIPNVPIFVDSPLASRATRVFAAHADALEDVEGDAVFDHPQIRYVQDVAESIRLNSISGAVIMAASGMCEAGRIRHHLENNLHRREASVLFVGFQARGSLGRVILDGASRVRISGKDVAVRARIRHIDSYSAHADQDELVDWISARMPIRQGFFLTHGEEQAIATLRERVQGAAPGLRIVAPSIGERFALPPADGPKRIETGRTDLDLLAGEDWQNDYADFVTHLKKNLGKIRSERARRDALAQMRRVLDSYEAARSRRGHRQERS